ncbi:TetR family transcriptional regulator [Gordonia sp. TBRC 11910]|uniref:TetR family transcriptional regulator n=1 Tax=Gordonia asplenii TaxID=2725283 RepID=A0A848KNF3_9ACTN|nr:TetR family transcriptional regulator [Gordonia asplenii]NMN99799.1 TetR family transcriptional regulator [Gordonia asplenii]
MPHRLSRRLSICDAALDLAAGGGNHAVTHSAIDAALGIAKGSTSYYFRTRAALIDAAIDFLTERSRARFAELSGGTTTEISVDGAAAQIAAYLVDLLGQRRRDLLARYAFAPDAAADEGHRAALARCLFSIDAATGLLDALGADDPSARAADLLTLIEGIALDFTYGHRSLTADEPHDVVEELVRRWLVALVA